jgi:beta-fructofuranosidase
MTDSSARASYPSDAAGFAQMRAAFAHDRHHPLYHFVAPANWMNDPNGAFFWKGKYHLFYQYNPNGPFWGTIHWGHAVSSDLVHWEDMPVALTPSKDGPDQNGCWSGCIVDDNGIPTAFYTGIEPQTVCVATSDDELRNWKKSDTPLISSPPSDLQLTGFPSITGHPSADFRDPFVWQEAGRWFMLIGAGMREKGGTALLYDSEDLRHWRYRQPILSGKIGADCNMWECPVLLRFLRYHVLLVCPHPEAKYVYWIAGEWRNGTLQEHRRDKLDWGTYVYAAQCLHDLIQDRYLVWTWIKEGRSIEAQWAAGWSGVLSLPKTCRLDGNGALVVRPAPELTSLRRESRSIADNRLTPASENPFAGFEGDCLEINVELSLEEQAVSHLHLRVSPDDAEQTTITYHSEKERLIVDCSRSSLNPDTEHQIISAPLTPDQQGRICFRVFLDRSVLEVCLADQRWITQRLYPAREDSLGLRFKVTNGSAIIHQLSVWKLASIWPDAVRARSS